MLKIETLRLPALSLAAALAIGATSAHADIITTLQSFSQNGDGTYTYVYDMSLSANAQLDPVANGVPAQFGTIYDFGPEVTPGVATGYLQSSFQWTFSNTDTPAQQTAPYDNPLLRNIRFTYVGTTGIATQPGSTTNPDFAIIPSGDDNLGTLTLISAYDITPTTSAQYDGQSFNSVNGTMQANIGFLRGPDVQTSVPEPASILMLGAGLLGLGLARRRKA